MDSEEIAAAQANVAEMLMNIGELCAPLFESAEGVRLDMVKRGYTDVQAGEIATKWLLCSLPIVVRP